MKCRMNSLKRNVIPGFRKKKTKNIRLHQIAWKSFTRVQHEYYVDEELIEVLYFVSKNIKLVFYIFYVVQRPLCFDYGKKDIVLRNGKTELYENIVIIAVKVINMQCVLRTTNEND